MGAHRIGQRGGYSDLKLRLEQVGNRVVAELSSYDDLNGPCLARHESEPNWEAIRHGVDVLQNPELNPGRLITSLGEELGRIGFGFPIQSVLAAHLENRIVRLWLNAFGALASLPWEASTFPEESGPLVGTLSIHPGLSLIREVDGRKNLLPRTSSTPRVLVVWADPASHEYRRLAGIDKEVRSITRALSVPECRRFEVQEIGFATRSSLIRSLESFKPDILHFVGHGDILPTGGVLILESGRPNEAAQIHADELAELLVEANVQLAVLSGCMTGESVSGIGAGLIRSGIAAVVAMQAPISDLSAGLFARAFYSSLGVGESVDDAVIQARGAIRGAYNDWAIPVVFRTPFEGPCFDEDPSADVVPELAKKTHNLTYDDRPFIGRQKERIEIRDRICVKKQRLLTITGMGGMGKTRLGKQVAAELIDDFPDGVWMVECDAIEGREQLVGSIAEAIGLSNSSSSIESELIEHLSTRKLLLLLDCFEKHVSLADFIDSVLKRSPDCQVLVTSRILLGLSREFEYRLNPMTWRKKAGEPMSDSISLFTEAASHAVNEFQVTAKSKALIQELCQLLEGVPLALVLAAGRLRHLSLVELVEQIRLHPLEVLKRRGGPKDRQADLYRVVATSFLLLGQRECGLLDKLSLFVGSFNVEDAAKVIGWSKIEILHGLSTLRDHSLVQVQVVDDRTRYKLLDTVREFLEQLPREDSELQERQACAERHARLYGGTAEEIGNLMLEGRWKDGTTRLWTEIGNLRAACKFAESSGMHESARTLAGGLCRAYFDMALTTDFDQVIRMGFAAAKALNDRELEIKLLGLSGADAAVRKDEAGWRSRWGRRLELCNLIGDLPGAMDCLFDMAWECVVLSDNTTAEEYLARAEKIAAEASNHGYIASCYVVRAQIEIRAERFSEAKVWVAHAKDALRQCEDKSKLVYVNQHLCYLNEQLGDLPNAISAALTMIRLSMESHRHRNIAWGLLRLADFHERSHRVRESVLCHLAALKLQTEFPTRQGEKARQIYNQFLKKHEEAEPLALGYKKSGWPILVKEILGTAT